MNPIYLDHAAATPMRPRVRGAMAPFLEGTHGNASSLHRFGREARRRLEGAREQVAQTLGVKPEEVIFTAGGTESANLAVLGSFEAHRHADGPLFVRTAIEHSAVRESIDEVGARGGQVRELPVSSQGTVDEDRLSELLARRPSLVTMQWVNQETGMILPVPEVARLCAEAGVPFHVDAVQASGRVPLELDRHPISLLTLSGHKLGGPHGTGVLVTRGDVPLHPRLFGGGQERGLRPGSADVAGAVGMAEALAAAVEERAPEGVRLEALRDRLEEGLLAALPELRIHSCEAHRSPHILGLGIPGLPRDVLPGALDLEGLAASAGSACRSGSPEPSPVLTSLYGREYARATAPLRLSLGWSTTEDEVEGALELIPRVVERIRGAGVGQAI